MIAGVWLAGLACVALSTVVPRHFADGVFWVGAALWSGAAVALLGA
jgi:hypothetical protein